MLRVYELCKGLQKIKNRTFNQGEREWIRKALFRNGFGSACIVCCKRALI